MARRGFGSVRRLKSGNHQCRYLGPDARQHKAARTFARKADAEAWLSNERRYLDGLVADGKLNEWRSPEQRHLDALGGLKALSTAPTLAEYADRYLTRNQPRPSTARRYNSLLKLHVLPWLGPIRLPDLTAPIVAAWWDDRDPAIQRTNDQAYGLLHAILARAVDDEIIPANPAKVHGAGKASRRKGTATLTPDQVQAIADAMPARLSMAVHIGAWCGLRSGEVRELRRKDLDLDSGIIHVTRGVTRGDNGMVTGAPKTDAGIRDVAIPATLVPMLKAHLNAHAQIGDDGLLFYQTGNGTAMTDTHLGKLFRKACGLAEWTDDKGKGHVGVEGFTFHDLRAFALTQYATAGATTRELQDRAGHTTAAVAMRYQRIDPTHRDNVVQVMGERIITRAGR